MLLLSRTFEAVGNPDRALLVLEGLLAQDPEEMFRRQALKRSMELKDDGSHLIEQATTA